jgi:hypothetical protein
MAVRPWLSQRLRKEIEVEADEDESEIDKPH